MKRSYEILDHTADIGLRVRGRDLPALFEGAAEGLFHLILGGRRAHGGGEEIIEVEGVDTTDLLVRWLAELLFRFDARRRVCTGTRVEMLSPRRLRARVQMTALDPARHKPQMEIKAVTYCGAQVTPGPEGWTAEVVFDI